VRPGGILESAQKAPEVIGAPPKISRVSYSGISPNGSKVAYRKPVTLPSIFCVTGGPPIRGATRPTGFLFPRRGFQSRGLRQRAPTIPPFIPMPIGIDMAMKLPSTPVIVLSVPFVVLFCEARRSSSRRVFLGRPGGAGLTKEQFGLPKFRFRHWRYSRARGRIAPRAWDCDGTATRSTRVGGRVSHRPGSQSRYTAVPVSGGKQPRLELAKRLSRGARGTLSADWRISGLIRGQFGTTSIPRSSASTPRPPLR
jgi:hypothetical protein